MAWLPAEFVHPTWAPVCDGYHLRPITAADADLDYPAVMGSQPRLWSIFGQAWGGELEPRRGKLVVQQ